jgi:hypothetical protein
MGKEKQASDRRSGAACQAMNNNQHGGAIHKSSGLQQMEHDVSNEHEMSSVSTRKRRHHAAAADQSG